MRKFILLFLFSFSMINPTMKVKAEQTNKKVFPFEITSVISSNDGILIRGWGMASVTHHYDSSSSHYYELILEGKKDRLTFSATPHYYSQTNTMKVYNVRKCAMNEYYKTGGVCYYNYDYVGFEFYVPYSRLKINESYKLSLSVHSNVLDFTKTTPLFYPIHTPITEKKETILYKVSSNLYETHLRVAENAVFDRISPSKSGQVRKTSSMCSATYGYSRYFDEGSIYMNVYDRYPNESTTYYKLRSGYETSCRGGRNVIKEGSAYDSWIASNWVDFEGESMTISILDTNQPPNIEILNHPTIRDIDSLEFDFRKYIYASDPEEGNLTNKTYVKNKVDLSQTGEYDLELEVTDSRGLKATNTLHVTVIDGNTVPLIFAENITLYQYEKFDPLKNVTAEDKEDGDITHKLTYEGNVNTSVIGNYPIIYSVSDSKHAIAKKEIIISVIKNPNEKLRYISNRKEFIFYRENVPLNWREKLHFLIDQIKNPKIFSKRTLHY